MWEHMTKQAVSAMRPFTIVVEGNIGCGKTTFLNHFGAKNNKVLVVTEPVTQWRNVRGHNLLQLMYQDPKKWGFSFQTHVQLTMLQMHKLSGTKQSIKMMERSLHSARYCFVENLWQNGLMETEEKLVLDEWFQWLRGERMIDVDLVVYLRSSPKTVQNRILARGRKEESGVNLKLLQGLHKLHEDWLINKVFPVPAPVLILDAEKPLTSMIDEYNRCDDKIEKMLAAAC